MCLPPSRIVLCASTFMMLTACGPGYSELGTPGTATTTENSTTTGGTAATETATTTGGSGIAQTTTTTGGKSTTTTTGTTTGGTTTQGTTTAGATSAGATTVGASTAGSTTGGNALCPTETDTYNNYAGTFLASKCGGCHGFVSSYAAVANNAAAIQGRIDSGSMPTSGPLSAADQNRINMWFNCGLPE